MVKIELSRPEIDSIILALDQRTEYLQEMFKNERDSVLQILTTDYQDLKKKFMKRKKERNEWNARTQTVNINGHQRKKNQNVVQNADNT